MTKCDLIVDSNGFTKQFQPLSMGKYSIIPESKGRQSYKHVSRDMFLYPDGNAWRVSIAIKAKHLLLNEICLDFIVLF